MDWGAVFLVLLTAACFAAVDTVVDNWQHIKQWRPMACRRQGSQLALHRTPWDGYTALVMMLHSAANGAAFAAASYVSVLYLRYPGAQLVIYFFAVAS